MGPWLLGFSSELSGLDYDVDLYIRVSQDCSCRALEPFLVLASPDALRANQLLENHMSHTQMEPEKGVLCRLLSFKWEAVGGW